MKRGMMFFASMAFALVLCELVRADEVTRGDASIDSNGWAVSMKTARVFKVSPTDEAKDVLGAAKKECKEETGDDCEGIAVADDKAIVIALQCGRPSLVKSYLGVSLTDEVDAISDAKKKAAKSFRSDQECQKAYSSLDPTSTTEESQENTPED